MLTVTESAASHFAKILETNDVPEDSAVRIAVDDDGFSLQHDCVRDGDVAFEHAGRTVLIIDANVSKLLEEDTLDVKKGQLQLSHPRKER